jgi:NAD(P)-dependent dehydrogenase (short-subunit alcohol dehydrogenase family)
MARDKLPLHRAAQPDDIALAIMSLVGNGYLTGEIMVVDGGLTQVM